MIGYIHHLKPNRLKRKKKNSSPLLTMKLYPILISIISTKKRIENVQYVRQTMVTVDICTAWYAKDCIQRIEHGRWDPAKDANAESQLEEIMMRKLTKLTSNPNKTKQMHRRGEWLSYSDKNAKYKWIPTTR